MSRTYSMLGLGMALALSTAIARGEQPGQGNYSVFPIATDLQRFLLDAPRTDDSEPKVYVLLDGESIVDREGRIDAARLHLAALREALAPYAESDKGLVHFNSRFAHVGSHDGEELLAWGLEGFGRHAGFRRACASSSYVGDTPTWQQMIAEVNARVAGRADEGETPLEDALVRIYPVRTILSCYLTSNAACVAEVIPALDRTAVEGLPPGVRDSLLMLVPQAELRARDKIMLAVHFAGRDRNVADQLVEVHRKPLAAQLGFPEIAIRTSFDAE